MLRQREYVKLLFGLTGWETSHVRFVHINMNYVFNFLGLYITINIITQKTLQLLRVK